eukprot:Opistho-2@85086
MASETATRRLVDYWFQIGCTVSDGDVDPLTEALQRLCDITNGDIESEDGGRQEANSIQEKVKVGPVSRFPSEDHFDYAFPEALETFCLPCGPFLSEEPPSATCYDLVLTGPSGDRAYVSVMALHEPISSHKKLRGVYGPLCIGFISHWPIFSLMRDVLMIIRGLGLGATNLLPQSTDAVEAAIASFVSRIPVPPPGRTEISFTIAGVRLHHGRPHPPDLPAADFGFAPLFRRLSVENIISLLTAILLERRVVIYSSELSMLTLCTEAVLSLIHPFAWHYVYIPVLPSAYLEDFLDVPSSSIIGAHSSARFLGKLAGDIVVVDLNEGSVTTREPLPAPPSQRLKSLKRNLEGNLVALGRNPEVAVDTDGFDHLPTGDESFPPQNLRHGDGWCRAASNLRGDDRDAHEHLMGFSGLGASQQNDAGFGSQRCLTDTERLRCAFMHYISQFLDVGDYRKFFTGLSDTAAGAKLTPTEKGTFIDENGFEISAGEAASMQEGWSDGAVQIDTKALLNRAPSWARDFLSKFVKTKIFSRFAFERLSESQTERPTMLFDEMSAGRLGKDVLAWDRVTAYLRHVCNDVTACVTIKKQGTSSDPTLASIQLNRQQSAPVLSHDALLKLNGATGARFPKLSFARVTPTQTLPLDLPDQSSCALHVLHSRPRPHKTAGGLLGSVFRKIVPGADRSPRLNRKGTSASAAVTNLPPPASQDGPTTLGKSPSNGSSEGFFGLLSWKTDAPPSASGSPSIVVTNAGGSGRGVAPIPGLPGLRDYRRIDKDLLGEFAADDGHILDMAGLRRAIFYGGVGQDARRDIWMLLLGLIPSDASSETADALIMQRRLAYEKIKGEMEDKAADPEFARVMRRIEKDVRRTDRNHPLFAGDDNASRASMCGVLAAYAVHDTPLGYVQGMSDLLSPLLVVLGDESEAFWGLDCVLRRMRGNFAETEKTMRDFFGRLDCLLEEVDPEFRAYLASVSRMEDAQSGRSSSDARSSDMNSLQFSFRWFLLNFKREFEFDEVLSIWEASLIGPLESLARLFVSCLSTFPSSHFLVGGVHGL